MRVVGAVALLIFLVAAPAQAEDTTADIGKNRLGDGIEYSGNIPGQQGGNSSSGSGGGKGGGPQVYPARYPTLGTDETGQPCVDTAVRTFPTAQQATNYELVQEQRWLTLVGLYPICPGVVPPQQNPAVLAEAFWGEVLLPRPDPRIEPGWALTGRLSYLETRAPLTQTFTRETPLGTLTIQATGAFLVDWGDGTRTGPHEHAGAPWPDGRITHGYTHTGTVTVVVIEQWRATWNLAGRSGALTALRTEGRIDQFPVREVQAVRNR